MEGELAMKDALKIVIPWDAMPPDEAKHYRWSLQTLPISTLTGELWGTSPGVGRGKMTKARWKSFLRSEEREGYDFDGTASKMSEHLPLVITMEDEGVTLRDGWHRAAVYVLGGDKKFPAIVGVHK